MISCIFGELWQNLGKMMSDIPHFCPGIVLVTFRYLVTWKTPSILPSQSLFILQRVGQSSPREGSTQQGPHVSRQDPLSLDVLSKFHVLCPLELNIAHNYIQMWWSRLYALLLSYRSYTITVCTYVVSCISNVSKSRKY